MELRSLDLLPRCNSWEVSVVVWALFSLGGGKAMAGAARDLSAGVEATEVGSEAATVGGTADPAPVAPVVPVVPVVPWPRAAMAALYGAMSAAQPEHLARVLWCAASLGARAESSSEATATTTWAEGEGQEEEEEEGDDGQVWRHRPPGAAGRSDPLPSSSGGAASGPLVVERRWLSR